MGILTDDGDQGSLLPPSKRDTPDTSAVVPQHARNLRNLGQGFGGGRIVGASLLPRGLAQSEDAVTEDGETGDDAPRAWEWDDRHTVTAGGTQVATLSHIPVDESLVVRWHPNSVGGIRLTADQFNLSGNTVTIGDPGFLAAGDQFSFQYEYDPTEVTAPDGGFDPGAPILWARFDETSGGVVTDSSGHGHHGLFGGTGMTFGHPTLFPGLPGTSIAFNGAAWAEWAPGAAWQRTPEFTASLFVDFQSPATQQVFFAVDDLGFTDLDRVWLMNPFEAAVFYNFGENNIVVAGSGTGPHHYLMTCLFDPVGFGSGGGIYLHFYIDGIETAPPVAVSGMNTSTLWPLTVGMSANGQVGRFGGMVGRAQHALLYDHGFTQADVTNLYNQALGV